MLKVKKNYMLFSKFLADTGALFLDTKPVRSAVNMVSISIN